MRQCDYVYCENDQYRGTPAEGSLHACAKELDHYGPHHTRHELILIAAQAMPDSRWFKRSSVMRQAVGGNDLPILKDNLLKVAQHHKATCVGEECQISITMLLLLAFRAGIEFTDEERRQFT